jgi:hypothetical protein
MILKNGIGNQIYLLENINHQNSDISTPVSFLSVNRDIVSPVFLQRRDIEGCVKDYLTRWMSMSKI